MLNWDEFRHEFRELAIDKIFIEEGRLLADAISDDLGGSGDSLEYAQDIATFAIHYALIKQDVTVNDDLAEHYYNQMLKSVQEWPTFEELVEQKLNEMWDSGFNYTKDDWDERYGDQDGD